MKTTIYQMNPKVLTSQNGQVKHEKDYSEKHLFRLLAEQGIQSNDPRLHGLDKWFQVNENGMRFINEQAIEDLKREQKVVKRALLKKHIIPDFESFTAEIADIFSQTQQNKSGQVATYIPQLANVNPDYFAVSVCTVDGQVFSMGDKDVKFSVQSTHKPINYAIALEELGEQVVHQHIGKEPSGVSFNALTLTEKGLPHNPLINAGAIMSASLIAREKNAADKFEFILDIWEKLNGIAKPTFNNSIYLSERATADRNFALAYFMRENKAFPAGIDVKNVLEFYFQCCSVEADISMMARMAATFANSGVNPFTHQRVFRPSTVKNCLSIMSACGMYDYSGEFAFGVGIPAKSGVSGAIWLVIPNVMGICMYSPRLDKNGNSVRGIAFAKELVKRFNFHNFDSLNFENQDKKDPRRRKYATQAQEVMSLIFAASAGDLEEVKRLNAIGIDLGAADYDGRTAIHLAASENRMEVVKYLLQEGVNSNPKDRWGGTPLNDAEREGHKELVSLFKSIQ